MFIQEEDSCQPKLAPDSLLTVCKIIGDEPIKLFYVLNSYILQPNFVEDGFLCDVYEVEVGLSQKLLSCGK